MKFKHHRVWVKHGLDVISFEIQFFFWLGGIHPQILLDETAEATVDATMEDADLFICTWVRELIVSPVLKHVIDHDVASVQTVLFYV
jgi:hypothetical protein